MPVESEQIGAIAERATVFGRMRGAARVHGRQSWLSRVPKLPAALLLVFIVLGLIGPLITPHSPVENNLVQALKPPVWQSGGSWTWPLGTDAFGRDVFSRLLAGARPSLIIAAFSVVASGFIGLAVGLAAGYLGGWADLVLMRLTDIMLSIPYLLLVLAIAFTLGRGLTALIVSLSVTGWASYARVLRSETLGLRETDFVVLARVGGCSQLRIMVRYIAPGLVSTLIVLSTLQFGLTLIVVAALSFLGLGIQPPTPDWGLMLAEGRTYMFVAWWLELLPGLLITLTVLAANLLGDWLRVDLDPRLRQV